MDSQSTPVRWDEFFGEEWSFMTSPAASTVTVEHRTGLFFVFSEALLSRANQGLLGKHNQSTLHGFAEAMKCAAYDGLTGEHTIKYDKFTYTAVPVTTSPFSENED